MKINTHMRGFTLIELLVVIAIIGILASVVLASLNSARDKGADASIKSSLNNMRAQAAIYYDNAGNVFEVTNGSDSVCVNNSVAANPGISEGLLAADAANGAGAVVCNDDATAWAASAQLVADNTEYYCVDSTGRATTTATALGADLSCS